MATTVRNDWHTAWRSLEGPWQREPDRDAWWCAGLPCIALRNDLGCWCGYVGLDAEHPAFGAGRSAPISVHGGLTFAGAIDEHRTAPGMEDARWWIGFDCGHADDAVPAFAHITPGIFKNSRYKSLDFVRRELADVVEQLRSITKPLPLLARGVVELGRLPPQAPRSPATFTTRRTQRMRKLINRAMRRAPDAAAKAFLTCHALHDAGPNGRYARRWLKQWRGGTLER